MFFLQNLECFQKSNQCFFCFPSFIDFFHVSVSCFYTISRFLNVNEQIEDAYIGRVFFCFLGRSLKRCSLSNLLVGDLTFRSQNNKGAKG